MQSKIEAGSNPILDTFGITGLRKEGLYGFLNQLLFPLGYKIWRNVRMGGQKLEDVGYAERFITLGDFAALMFVFALASQNPVAALELKTAYNLGANLAYGKYESSKLKAKAS